VRAVEEPLPLAFEIQPGRVVTTQGEVYPGAWIVRSGRLLMEAVDAEGRRLAIDVLGRGDLVGGPAGWVAEATVRAWTETWLAPAGDTALRDGLARRAHRAASLAFALAWDPVPDRVTARLRDLAERFGRPVPGGTCLRFPLTQDDLAGLTGSNRETVNRALARLRQQGAVSGGGSQPYVVRGAADAHATPVGDSG
jgi:CRP/FNR family cyclic AMP-dependent transcriptional regulator